MKKKLVLMALLSVCSVLHGAADDEWKKQRVQQLCNQLVAKFGRTLVEVQPIVAELYSFMTLKNVLAHKINCLEGVERACKELQDPEIVKAKKEFERLVAKVEIIEECGQCSASPSRDDLCMLLCGLPVDDDDIEHRALLGAEIVAENRELAEAVAALQVAQNEDWREQEEAQFLDDVKRSPAEGGEEFYG